MPGRGILLLCQIPSYNIYNRLGRIPSPGDSVEYDGLKIRVVSTLGRRLKKLLVTKVTDVGAQSADRSGNSGQGL